MKHITVRVQDHEKAQLLCKILQALDFVMHISTDDQQINEILRQETVDRTEEFFSYAGLWSNREVSAKAIRQQAWPRQLA